jgi:hypothetical protein
VPKDPTPVLDLSSVEPSLSPSTGTSAAMGVLLGFAGRCGAEGSCPSLGVASG